MPDNVLVVLTPAFAAFEGDAWLPGVESFVRACKEVQPDLKIEILSFHFPVREDRRYAWYGNEVIAFGGEHKKGKIRSIMRWKQVWAELDRIRLKGGLVGIFSMFCSECAFVGHYYARRHKLQHRIWVMGQDARKSNNQVRRIRPKPEELICISDFLLREFERSHGIRPAFMIPYGIPEMKSLPDKTRDIDILAVGSLISLKQYDWLIEVVEHLLPRFPRLHAVLVGEGEERGFLEGLIRQKRLQHHVRLAGRIPHQEVFSIMQRSRLLLHPSSYEGLGLVCLEALSAGAEVLSRCKPFDRDIEHWHIADSLNDMKAMAEQILSASSELFTSIPFEANTTAAEVLRLFDLR